MFKLGHGYNSLLTGDHYVYCGSYKGMKIWERNGELFRLSYSESLESFDTARISSFPVPEWKLPGMKILL